MIELIPSIEILNRKCVRLANGDFNQPITYDKNPLETALEFEANGIRRIHIVDLDGANSNHVVNYRIVEQIACRTSLLIDWGGGLKSDQDLVIAFENGARRAVVGSTAVTCPELFAKWLKQYGNDKIILGADTKSGKIAIKGWQEETSEELIPFLKKYISKGISKVLCTDIQREESLEGPSMDTYQKIIQEFPDIYLIASGGIDSLHDIVRMEEAHIPAAILGKALYEGKITLKELYPFM